MRCLLHVCVACLLCVVSCSLCVVGCVLFVACSGVCSLLWFGGGLFWCVFVVCGVLCVVSC